MDKFTALGARLGAALSGPNAVYAILAFTVTAALLISRALTKKEEYVHKVLPVLVPLEIALTSHLVSANGWGRRVFSVLRRKSGSLFGLTTRHQILYDLPGVDRFLTQPVHVLENSPLSWTLLFRVFGVDRDVVMSGVLEKPWKGLVSAVERNFVNDAAATAALERSDMPAHAVRLVSFASDPADQCMWEAAANVKVLSAKSPSQRDAVEADLHPLMRDFGLCISAPQLFGADFLSRGGTSMLADFWTFDNTLFPLLIVGLPKWLPLKVMKNGLAARSRFHDCVAGVYKRVDQTQLGEPVDFGVDMSDVSAAVQERNRLYREAGVSVRHRGQLDSSLFWGQNANTQPLAFWLLTYIYSTPGLVEELRKEIAAFVPVDTTAQPPHITDLDLGALSRDCPLLKSALYETFRLANNPTSIRYLAQPVTVTDGPHKHQLPAQTWVSAVYGAIQRVPEIFPDPEKFVPDRFIVTEVETGKQVARYGRLKPWGAGNGMCKGRTFAEKELLGIAACIISLWDIEPVGGTWKLPGMRPGTGTMAPIGDVRVLLKRRLFT